MVAEDDVAAAEPSMRGRRPRVFVAYAHDSPSHEADVVRLCELLVRNGVDVRLDKWFLDQRRGWGEWTVAEIRTADYVLAVASPALRRAGDGEAGADELRGAQAETALLRELLQQDRPTWRRKILPVLLPGRSWRDVPMFLHPWNDTRFAVSGFTLASAESLIRFLTKQPAYIPPKPGDAPCLPPRQSDDDMPSYPASQQADSASDPDARPSPQRAAQGENVQISDAFSNFTPGWDGREQPRRQAPDRHGKFAASWPRLVALRPLGIVLSVLAVVMLGAAILTYLLWLGSSDRNRIGAEAPNRSNSSSPHSSTAAAGATQRHTLKVSNNPLTSDKDKIDLDTGCPGRGSQPQLVNHCGRLADLILDPERLHTVDNDPRMLFIPAGASENPADCRRALDSEPDPRSGSIDLGRLVKGSAICMKTDEGNIAYASIVELHTGYPATLIIDWAVNLP